MLSVSLIRCRNEALKKKYFKSTIRCFKRVRNKQETRLVTRLISPMIDRCVRIKAKPDRYWMTIFSQRFIDSDCTNFKNFCIPGCLLIHLNITIEYCYGCLHRKMENKCFFWLSFNFSGMLASSNIYILSSFCLHPISLRMPKLSTLLIVTFPAYLKFCFFLQGLTHNPSSYPLNCAIETTDPRLRYQSCMWAGVPTTCYHILLPNLAPSHISDSLHVSARLSSLVVFLTLSLI